MSLKRLEQLLVHFCYWEYSPSQKACVMAVTESALPSDGQMGYVLLEERERIHGSPPATQQGEFGDQLEVESSNFFEKAFLLYSVAYLELVRQVWCRA